MADNQKPVALEAVLARLDTIARSLESGDQPLEEALKLFEEGVSLARDGQKRIDDAEKRIEILLAAGSASERTEPFADRSAAAADDEVPF